jgi:Na+-driven multidrug efflux pump
MNISNTVSNTFSVLFLSVGTSISILLGHRLGAGQKTEAQEDSHRMIAFSLCMGMCAMLLIGATAFFFPQIYNTTDEVRSLAVEFSIIMAFCSPLHAFLHAAYFTIRSGGKTLITFLFDSGYVWCVNVVLAFTLSRYTALSAPLVYLTVQGVDLIKAAIGTVLVKKGTWATDMTEQL